jgi:sodium transport system permease protein
MIVPVIPTMLLSISPQKTQGWMYAVPLMGQQVALTRLLRGDGVALSELTLCFACTALTAFAAYRLAVWVYKSERLAISA